MSCSNNGEDAVTCRLCQESQCQSLNARKARNAIATKPELGTPLCDVDNIDTLQQAAENLWKLLDHIDTASDMFKPTDLKGYETFYKYAMKMCEERGKILESDGYNLFLTS